MPVNQQSSEQQQEPEDTLQKLSLMKAHVQGRRDEMQQAIADEQHQIAHSISAYKKWSEMKKDPSLVH